MKKLYVGCRVRILYSENWPELIGQEGTITKHLSADDLYEDEKGCEWNVAPDTWGVDHQLNCTDGAIEYFSPNSSALEPIVDDGRKVISWEECLWQPEHIEQGVAA